MSFCVSHRSALDKNIRHLYSGLPSDIRFRSYGSSKSGAIDVHDRVFQKHKRPPERFDSKFQEYVPEYGTRLPRAPAFRSVSPEEVKEISNRLSRPTVMSTIRHQSASSRSGNHSSSRRGRSEMSAEDEDGSEAQREGLNSREGYGHRKVCYKDWSDNESGVYYYEDEARRDSITDSKNQSMDDTITDQAKQDENDWMYREDPYSSSQDVLSERSEKNERTISSLSSNNDNDRDQKDTEKDNNSSLKTEDKGKKSKTTTQGPNNSKSSSQPKRKMNILEQIMQARNTRQRQPYTKTQNGTLDSKRLNRRGNVENRLGLSPYCEPMPYLYLMYGPPHKTRPANQRNKNAPQKRLFSKEAAKQHQTTTKTYSQQDAGSRPQTRAASTRQRKEAITYQYRPESRAKLSDGPPKRSKSAPLYAERKGQRMTSKRPTTQETQERKTSMKTGCASNKSKPKEAHQNNTAGKTKFVKKSTDPSSSRDSSVDSEETVSTPRYEDSTQNQGQNSRRMSRSESSRSVNRIYRADYDTLCKMYSSNLHHENGKRYSSPTEMQKANKRLLKPTTAKKIRDRLRYAPDNDRNLSDPVKVVHEAVEGKRKKNDRRGRIDEGDNEDDYEEEEAEEEEKSVEVKKKEADKEKFTTKRQGKITKTKDEPKKAPTGVDHRLGLRGRSKGHNKQKSRSSSRSSRSSESPEMDSRKNKGHKKSQNAITKSRSASRSRSPSSRKSSASLSRSPTPTRSRSRSRSGSRSNGRSRSRSGSSSRRSSPASLKTETTSSTIASQQQSSVKNSEDQTLPTEEDNFNISRGANEGKNCNNSGASFEDNDENSEIKNSSSYSNGCNTHQQTRDSDSETERDASISYNSELIERTRLANSPGENEKQEYSIDYKNAGRGDEYQDMNGRGDDDQDEGTKIIVPRLRGEVVESTPSPEAGTRSPSPEVTYSVRTNVRSHEKTNDITASASDGSSEDETETGADLTLRTDSSYSELKSFDKDMTKESQPNQQDDNRETKSQNTSLPNKDAQYHGTSNDANSSRNTPEGLASNHEDLRKNPNEAGQNTPQTQKQYSKQPLETETIYKTENQVAGSEPTQFDEAIYLEDHGTTS